jgi:predicted kinase
MDTTLVNALREQLQRETGQPVALVETHISWVLLTQTQAFKLKKPVRLPFLDFGSVEARKHFCEEELRLNRRFAPSLYIDVAPVCGTRESPRIGGAGTVIDHVVRMLRFPDSSLLRNLLVEDRLQPALLDGFAQRLAALHAAAERATPVSGFGSPDCGEARPDYLACAMRLTTQPEEGARPMITHGLSGSGKSSVALQLLCAAGAVRVRSDVERKRLYGLDPLARSVALGLDIYGAQATLRTFERLRACARDALLAGYPVIVDAAFLRGAERRSFEALAAEFRVPFTILDCRATPATLRRRVAERDAAGTDASEASLAILPLAERVLTENDWRDPMTGHVPDLEYNALFTRIVNVVPVPISLGPAPPSRLPAQRAST